MCPLSGNSTLSNKFKVLHDKEKMDNCNGYFEVKEKEENVASGNVAHDFDLGSDKTMVKGFESFDGDSNYNESQEMVALMIVMTMTRYLGTDMEVTKCHFPRMVLILPVVR